MTEAKKRPLWVGQLFESKADFYEMLVRHAEKTLQGVEALAGWIRHGAEERCQLVRNLEKEADELKLVLERKLVDSFVTPFDREDIYSLTKSMDDVLDLMDHVADLLVLYHIEKLEDGMTMLLEVTRRAVNDIHKSVHTLRNINYDKIREHIISVHALENEGDRLYRHFMGTLYGEEHDAIRLMKNSSIYNELEHTVDKCEDLMNAIESIVLKQA